MINKLKSFINTIKSFISFQVKVNNELDELKYNIGALHAEFISKKNEYEKLSDLEFKVYSQFGDDGIIQYIINHVNFPYKTFIEFGVEDYFESNTRFLLQKDNWTGFVMDGSEKNINRLIRSNFFWKHDLEAKSIFITKDNINELIDPYLKKWGGLGILHIDLDGNDYWIWNNMEIRPIVLILEYNSIFGCNRPITVPYDPMFYRTNAHFSNLFWGSSIKSLHDLTISRGYKFLGCNSAGNNAYFILSEFINDNLKSVSLNEGFVNSKYRESCNESGKLTFLDEINRINIIKGLKVFNTELKNEELL